MPKLTLDGKEIEFKEGQTIIQVAMEHGVEIPHFCWHPELSVSGNCRMCLVEVEQIPKLAISCATMAADGMVVQTNSEKTVEARKAVLEFILINHPLDCPICDEAGECQLQDYAYAYSVGESRMVEEKNHKPKRVKLGPHVTYDAERCISCSRCIRFSREIAQEPQLTFVQRGDRVMIATFPGESFDNPYSMNAIDICPVGALTSTDFRFKSRVWEMSKTESVCTGCSRGCNIEIWVRDNKIQRLTPRFNNDVNSYWMCDNGRLNTFKFVNSDTRVDGAQIKKDGNFEKVEWEEAFRFTSENLKKYKADEIAFIGSAFATVEDNYVFAKLAKNLGVKNISYFNYVVPGSGDNILITEDKAPNSLGAELVGIKTPADGFSIENIFEEIKNKKIKAVYILEQSPEFESDLLDALSNAEFVAVHAFNFGKLTDFADVVFPAATYAEKNGTFVNFQGRAQRIKPAVATAESDRSLDGLSQSRWDKFGTEFDRWNQGKRYDAKSSWKILTMLSTHLGEKFNFKMAEEVFEELASKNEYFKGLNYDELGGGGVKLKNLKFSEEAV